MATSTPHIPASAPGAGLPQDPISTSAPPARAVPQFQLTFDPSLAAWNKSVQQWAADNDKHFDGLAVGAHVYDPAGRVLLVQRAAGDSMPNLWEVPGGAADAEDPTLFKAAARELWEETGLRARHLARVITEGRDRAPGSVFTNSRGTKILCKFSFEIEVESCEEVQIDPNEHQAYVWASEEEVRAGETGEERKIPLTHMQTRSLILEGFRLRKGVEGSLDKTIDA